MSGAPTVQCVILAGGLGTRMEPLTGVLPKTLIPVAGHPFAHHQLSALAAAGARSIVYSIGHLGAQVRAFVGDGARWGLEVRYVDEGDDLRGTAGALRAALDAGVLAEDFLVTYGDSYLRLDYGALLDVHRRRAAEATMAVYRNDGRWDTSNVRYREGRVELYDKRAAPEVRATMQHIDYGVSALARRVVEERIPTVGRWDLADVFHELSREGKLAGVEASHRFYEIGTPAGLEALRGFLAGNVEEPAPC